MRVETYAGRAPQRRARRAVVPVLALLLIGSAGCSSAPGPTEQRAAPPAADTPVTPTADGVRALLADVRRVDRRPDEPGYDRDCGPGDACVFGTEWSDDTDAPSGRNGCDTRNDVLGSSLTDVRFEAGSNDCDVVGGILADPYTGTTMDYARQGSEIHVDHLFPLAAAWDLGAAAWSPDERAAFANDTELELVAVQGRANLSKGDSTPASWLPPDRSYRCTYVTDYLQVALHYDLAVTAADVRVIEPVIDKEC